MRMRGRTGDRLAGDEATRTGRRWLSLLLGSTILGCATLTIQAPSFAQQAVRPVTASQAVRISIPSQPLTSAMDAFSRATGWQVGYSSALARSTTTRAVSGTMSPGQALQAMLAGTSVQIRITGEASAALVDASSADAGGGIAPDGTVVLGTIDVQSRIDSAWGQIEGYIATYDTTATKTDTPLIEVPQTVNVVTRDQIEAQGSQSVTEATRYTPGLIETFGDSNNTNDVLQSRGFYVRYNLNGSRLPYGAYSTALLQVEPYGLERIDVMKGPASVLYGQNLPGGLVNLSSKRPLETPLREVAIQGGSHDHLQGMFDFSGPLDPEGQFLYRFTGLARDADGRVDFGYDKRLFLAPSFTWQPTDATSLTFFGQYQKDKAIPDYAALPAAGTLYPNPNGKLPASRYAGEPGFDGYEREQYSVGYNFRHDFDNNWTLRQNLQFNHVDVDTKASPSVALDPSQRYLMRVATHGLGVADTFTVDTNVEGEFDTGFVQHNMLIGIDYLHLSDSYKFASNVYDGGAFSFDLYDPVYGATPPPLIPRIDYQMKRNQVGIYAQDQMRWENWILTAGLRHDWVKADSFEAIYQTPFSFSDSALTGRVGLTYLFDNGFAPYVSYSTSFDPIDGVTITGGPLKPLEGEQIEAGIKYQSADGGTFITLSAFQIDQKNVSARNPDPLGTGLVQIGEARVRGVEVEAKTKLMDRLNLIASYAYMDSEFTKANPGSENMLGKELRMVPRNQASIWLDYEVPDGALAGLGIGGGLRYQGKSFGDELNQFEVGGRVLVDASLSYDFGKLDKRFDGLNLKVTGINLLNKEYVSYCQSDMLCYYGQGRTVNATLKYRW